MDEKTRVAKAKAVGERLKEATTDSARLDILERFFRELRKEGEQPNVEDWLRLINATLGLKNPRP